MDLGVVHINQFPHPVREDGSIDHTGRLVYPNEFGAYVVSGVGYFADPTSGIGIAPMVGWGARVTSQPTTPWYGIQNDVLMAEPAYIHGLRAAFKYATTAAWSRLRAIRAQSITSQRTWEATAKAALENLDAALAIRVPDNRTSCVALDLKPYQFAVLFGDGVFTLSYKLLHYAGMSPNVHPQAWTQFFSHYTRLEQQRTRGPNALKVDRSKADPPPATAASPPTETDAAPLLSALRALVTLYDVMHDHRSDTTNYTKQCRVDKAMANAVPDIKYARAYLKQFS